MLIPCSGFGHGVPPPLPPSLARESLPRTTIRGPRREAVFRPVRALPGRTAANPLPASPASGRGDFMAADPSPETPSLRTLNVVPSSRFVPLVPFAPPPAGPRDGTLIRAYPARAPAPVGARFAPARFARLIARVRLRARAKRRAHFARWPNQGPFRAGANREARRRRECRLVSRPLIWLFTLGCQAYAETYFLHIRTSRRLHRGRGRSPTRNAVEWTNRKGRFKLVLAHVVLGGALQNGPAVTQAVAYIPKSSPEALR